MQTSSNIAFKEWAVIVDALGRGDQVVILRKGGIIEDKGQFTVDHEQFWLFPTLFHQQMESVLPDAQRNFDQIKELYQPEGSVRIEYFVKTEKIMECSDLAKVKALSAEHVWKESVIEERFRYGKKDGIHIILARVFRLAEPQILSILSTYGGCKSWVELERSISAETLTPVLSDAEFKTKAERVVAALL